MALFDFATMGKEMARSMGDVKRAEEPTEKSDTSSSNAEYSAPSIVSNSSSGGKSQNSFKRFFNRRRSTSEETPGIVSFAAPLKASEENEISSQIYQAGYYPAYVILKSMSQADRDFILKKLLIKKRSADCPEVEARDILLKRIFGLRARTSTAFRSVGIMQKPTWVHTLVKTGTAMNINLRMVFSSGDWRLPTRLTDGLRDKDALIATTSDFHKVDNPESSLIQAELRVLRKLQKVVEKRLGSINANAIGDLVLAECGEENREILDRYAQWRNKRKLKHEKQKDKIDKAKSSRAVVNEQDGEPGIQTLAEAEYEASLKPVDITALRTCFSNLPKMVANIEQVKPGFGHFAVLVVQTFALKAVSAGMEDCEFEYTKQKDLIKKLAVVGAKDGAIGLSLGIPLATFVNPFLGFPLMTMSLINLSLGSTELNMIESVCMMMMHVLVLASNGTCLQNFA